MALVTARALLRAGSLSRMERLSRRLVRRLDASDVDADGLRWAVDAVANRIGGECLPRAFALQWLLARRGVATKLCIGVASDGSPFPGHAWLESRGEVVIGGPVPDRTTLLREIEVD